MAYEIVVLDDFRDWYEDLSMPEQRSVQRVVGLLEDAGPSLVYPYTSGIHGSKFPNMRELRVQHEGRPYRILYAFDPKRCAILITAGDKTGDGRWYEKAIPKADRLYGDYLRTIKR